MSSAHETVPLMGHDNTTSPKPSFCRRYRGIFAILALVAVLAVAFVFLPSQMVSKKSQISHNALQRLTIEDYTEAAIADLITVLPGLEEEIDFLHFAGYVDYTAYTGEDRSLFYWFIESQNDPANDPIVFWTNGGPSCSGLLGLLTEQGPYWVQDDLTLYMNSESWTKDVNMVFVEQPFGVGFSSNGDEELVAGDVLAAQDFDAFMRQFMVKFPSYLESDTYISAESWGGHYMPYTALAILEHNDAGDLPFLNFKGYLVGNPYDEDYENTYGFIRALYGHGMVQESVYEEFTANCKSVDTIDDDECYGLYVKAYLEVGDIDFYALDYPECVGLDDDDAFVQKHKKKGVKTIDEVFDRYLTSQPLMKFRQPRHKLAHQRKMLKATKKIMESATASQALKEEISAKVVTYFADAEEYIWCSDNDVVYYLNQADVQDAIHADTDIDWDYCTDDVYYAWPESDWYTSMAENYQKLVNDYDIKILIYQGDDDSVCGMQGTQWWLNKMDGWEVDSESDWFIWIDEDEQVGGYYSKYILSDTGNTALHYMTVRSAGHMVPQTQPARSRQVLNWFLDQE